MTLERYRTGVPRAVLSALALLALAFGVVVPPGFMPARAADRSIRVLICTGTGPAEGVLSLDGTVRVERIGGAGSASNGHGVGKAGNPDDSDHGEGKGSNTHSPCLFAGHAAPLDTPDIALAPTVEGMSNGAAVRVLRAFLLPGRGMAAPPPPAHAPPFLSV